MTEILYIGASPSNEDCAQVSTHRDYMPQMRAELYAYQRQLERTYPPPKSAEYRIKWENHEFGRYGEVVAVFDPNDPYEVEWALMSEYGCEDWDDKALEDLAAAGFPLELR